MHPGIDTLQLDGAKCLLRVDLNVPLAPDGSGAILNEQRLLRAAPTVRELRRRNAAVIIMSHLGRPKGKPSPQHSLSIVSRRLAELTETPIRHVPDIVGQQAQDACRAAQPGQAILLENLRFDPREEANDPQFAQQIAALGDAYVNDAFGVSHRSHASVAGVPRHLPSACGPQLLLELEMLGAAASVDRRPAIVVLSGAKADKLKILANLIDKLDAALLGGGMAAAFLLLKGRRFKGLEVAPDELEAARGIAERHPDRIVVPDDFATIRQFKEDAPAAVRAADAVEADDIIMDIGPRTVEKYAGIIAGARTVIWNGPLGFYEWQPYRTGTVAVARAIAAQEDAFKVAGGGSTVSAITDLELGDRFSHVSNGGGASLKMLEGASLAGVQAILNAKSSRNGG